MIEQRDIRSATIEAANDADLLGWYYDSPETAKAAAITLAVEAPSKKVALYDVDDTLVHSEPWLRAKLNSLIQAQIPDFKAISLEEVVRYGGRYYQVPAYQEAATKMGVPFIDLWNQVGNDPEAHRMMLPWPGAKEVQAVTREKGYQIAGYPTARPQEIVRLTASSLKYHGFECAPVIDTKASSSDPSTAKLAFFEELLAAAPEAHFLFVDDHVSTAKAIHSRLADRVAVYVPMVPRNRQHEAELSDLGIAHGTFREIQAMIAQS